MVLVVAHTHSVFFQFCISFQFILLIQFELLLLRCYLSSYNKLLTHDWQQHNTNACMVGICEASACHIPVCIPKLGFLIWLMGIGRISSVALPYLQAEIKKVN